MKSTHFVKVDVSLGHLGVRRPLSGTTSSLACSFTLPRRKAGKRQGTLGPSPLQKATACGLYLTANEGAREASSPSPPVRSLLVVLSSQNNKGKPRASKESFDRLVNVFQTGRSVPLHKNHFFLNHLTVQ